MKWLVLSLLLNGLGMVSLSCVQRSDRSSIKTQEPKLYEGVGTNFDSHGFPYGGCGVPEANLDSRFFVALNVQNTPNDYSNPGQHRPLEDRSKMGAWENGRNCGRWVRVTIGDFCQAGMNSGQKGTKLCQGGRWIKDEFNGATLDLVVTDSCQDDNVWCRDNQFHLDLATASLDQFKPGLSKKWGNRLISWKYVPAPNYTGDIKIGFRLNTKPYWPAITITHLENGVHWVEQEVNGGFKKLKNDGDMGQSFVLEPNLPSNTYKIRIADASDQLIHGGRVYEFSFPKSCAEECKQPFVEVAYKTTGGAVGAPSPKQDGRQSGDRTPSDHPGIPTEGHSEQDTKPETTVVVPQMKTQGTGDCSYEDAYKHNGWGYNKTTKESCPPVPTDNGCSYEYAYKYNGWGYNKSTGQSCPPRP